MTYREACDAFCKIYDLMAEKQLLKPSYIAVMSAIRNQLKMLAQSEKEV